MSNLTLEKRCLSLGKLYKGVNIESKKELGRILSGDIRKERKNLNKLSKSRSIKKRNA